MCPALRVQQTVERRVARQPPHVNLKCQRHMLPTIIKRLNRSSHLLQPRLQICLLPQPKDVIEVSMVQEEERIARTVGYTTSYTKHASDTKVTATMDVPRSKAWDAFHLACHTCVVWLIEDFCTRMGSGKVFMIQGMKSRRTQLRVGKLSMKAEGTKAPSLTHPPPVWPVLLSRSCSGVASMKSSLPPKPLSALETAVS
jgi:hypothetical protein